MFAAVDNSSLLYSFFLCPFECLLRRVQLYCVDHQLCLRCWHLLRKEIRALYCRFQLSGYLAKPALFDETKYSG